MIQKSTVQPNFEFATLKDVWHQQCGLEDSDVIAGTATQLDSDNMPCSYGGDMKQFCWVEHFCPCACGDEETMILVRNGNVIDN